MSQKQMEDILQNTWPSIFKSVKVSKDKENLRNCHIGDERDSGQEGEGEVGPQCREESPSSPQVPPANGTYRPHQLFSTGHKLLYWQGVGLLSFQTSKFILKNHGDLHMCEIPDSRYWLWTLRGGGWCAEESAHLIVKGTWFPRYCSLRKRAASWAPTQWPHWRAVSALRACS